MTPNELLNELKRFIEEQTKDIILSVRPVNNKVFPEPSGKKKADNADNELLTRAAEVYLMRLPDKDAETNRKERLTSSSHSCTAMLPSKAKNPTARAKSELYLQRIRRTRARVQ